MGRALRRLVRWVGFGVLAVLGLSLGFVIWISTGGGERWVESRIEGLVTDTMSEGRLEIGGLGIDARSGLVARRIVLRDGVGDPVVQLEQLTIDMRPTALLSRRVRLPAARVEGLRVALVADAAGVLNIGRLFGQTEPSTSDEPWGGLPLEILVDEVDLRGVTVTYQTPAGLAFALAGAHGRATVHGKQDRVAVSGIELVGQVATPAPLVAMVSGDVVYSGSQGITISPSTLRLPHGAAALQGRIGDTLELEAALGPVALRAFDPLLGDIGLGGRWEGTASVSGTPEHPVATAQLYGLGESRGRVDLDASADLSGEVPTWEATADLSEVHVSDVMVVVETDIELAGHLDVEGHGLSWPDGLHATGHWTGGRQLVAGQEVDAVDARVTLSDGRIEIDERTTVQGILGTLMVSGEVSLVDGPMDVRVRGSVEPARLAQLGAVGFGSTGTVDARVRGDLQHLEHPIRAYGSVRYAPFRYDGGVEIARLVADFDAEVIDGEVDGTATLSGSGVSASGVVASTLSSRPLRLSVREQRTTLDGSLQLQQVAVDPVASIGRVGVDLDVDLVGGRMRVDADLGIDDWTLAARPGGERGYGRVVRVDDEVQFQVELYDGARLALDTTGSFQLEASQVEVSRFLWAPTPRATWRSVEPWQLALTDGGVSDSELIVASELGTATVRGTLGTSGILDGTVRVEGLQLDHLSELYPDRFVSMSGTLDVGLDVTGDARDPRVDGTVDLDGLWFGESVRWLDLTGRFTLDDGLLVPQLELGVAGERLGFVNGSVPVRGDLSDPALLTHDDASLALAIAPGSFERLARLAPSLEDADLPAGVLSAMVTSSGPLSDPELHVAGVAEVRGARAGARGATGVRARPARRGHGVLDRAAHRLRPARHHRRRGQDPPGRGVRLVRGRWSRARPRRSRAVPRRHGDLGGVAWPAASTLVAMADVPTVALGELVGGVSVTGSPPSPWWRGASTGSTPSSVARPSRRPACRSCRARLATPPTYRWASPVAAGCRSRATCRWSSTSIRSSRLGRLASST